MHVPLPPVRLTFEGELNDFLPPERRGRVIEKSSTRRASVKDFIESFGVPHTEVGEVVVNGTPVDFSYIVCEGDRIDVHPIGSVQGDRPRVPLRSPPPRPLRFVADANVGQLARHLRLLGLDVVYRSDIEDDEVASIASRDERVVLTRDRALLQRRIISHGCFVRAHEPRAQTREILARLDLHHELRPFSRCLRCNGQLVEVEKEAVLDQLEPKTRLFYTRFRRCPECGRVYWRGSHFERMERLCAELMEVPPA